MRNSIRLAVVALALLLSLTAAAVWAQETTPEAAVEAMPEAAETEAAEVTETGQSAAALVSPGLITGLRHLHSLVRWLVVIIAAAAILRLAVGLAQGAEYDSLAHRLMVGFSAGLTVQWVIGLAFLVAYGSVVGFGLRHFWEHLVVMTVAVGLSHMHSRFKLSPARLRYRNGLIIVVVALLLVVVGVALLPQGWRLFPPG